MQTHFQSTSKTRNSQRDGIALVMAIIILILTSSISLSMIRTTSLRQQRFENRQHKTQASLIADSALERVRQKLQVDENYSGETWKIETASDSGKAMIEVNANGPQSYDVKIVAAYPLDVPHRTQASIQTTVSLSAQPTR